MDSSPNPRVSNLYSAAPPGARRSPRQFIGERQQIASAALGGMFAGWGVRRGGLLGAAAGVAGAALLARGLSGLAPVKRAMMPSPYEEEEAHKHGWKSAAASSWAVTIDRPRQELYKFWRDFANLPDIFEYVEKVEVIDETRSEWTVTGPAGVSLKWHADVTEDVPGQRIAWASDEKSMVRNTGWVEFREGPEGRGTEVHAFILYEPPGGQAGRALAKILRREPDLQLRRDLRRFKQLMEAGEISANMPQNRING